MQKIKDYIDRFFKNKAMDEHYTLRTSEAVALIDEMRRANANGLYDVIAMLFRFGYVKGYRAAKAEMKKAGGAYAK